MARVEVCFLCLQSIQYKEKYVITVQRKNICYYNPTRLRTCQRTHHVSASNLLFSELKVSFFGQILART